MKSKFWLILFIPIVTFIVLFFIDGNAEELTSDDLERVVYELEEKDVYELEEIEKFKEVQVSASSSSTKDHRENSDIFNILVIGVDEGGFDNSRSDVMIVASINPDKKDIKLTSVMRDTLSYIPTSKTYQKLNHSYMEGGPKETVRAFNANFDLDIKDYVVFDFNAVSKVVDAVGGYPATINAGESKDMGMAQGSYVLNGDQAVKYMRIRYNSGGDAGRNQRQRDLMEYVMKKAMDLGKKDMLSLATKMLPLVRTSYNLFDISQLLDIYGMMGNELSIKQFSFPSQYEGTKLADGLWYAVPNSMIDNVIKLHSDIYETEQLLIDNNVNTISENIQQRSGVY